MSQQNDDTPIDFWEIYDHAPDMHLSVEAGTGRILECNQTLLDNLGYDKPEVLSKHVFDMYHPDELEKVRENLQSFSRDGKLKHTEFRVLKSDGSTLEVSLKFSAVADETGKILYSNAVWRDVSEIKTMQRALEAEKRRTEDVLLNVLPRSIVERLKSSPAVIADDAKNATILFCDIAGFTQLSRQLSPEKLISSLNIVFSEFDHLVGFYELEKIKTIGDAYMIASGVPVARDDHAEVVADLALEMMQCVARLNDILDTPIEIRIGIESGPVVAGVIGKKKFAYDLWGESVNTAARMESHGVIGEIQVGPNAYDLLKDLFEFERRGEIEVKGIGQLEAYLLKRKKADS